MRHQFDTGIFSPHWKSYKVSDSFHPYPKIKTVRTVTRLCQPMSTCPHRVQQLKTCPFPEDISGISSEVSLVISASGCLLMLKMTQ